jgi:membrane-bound metal-dependent hydrolase YbcI (DUF457 family)
MFIGHHAAALAAKKYAPEVSLGTLLAATMWLDLLWPLMLLLGVEHVRINPGNTAFTPLDFHHYPYTHSLLVVAAWAAAGALLYRIRGSSRGALIVFAGILSHWALDFVTHRPDLPLWPGGPKTGLGLWNSVPGTVVLESALFAGGLALYLRATKPRDRTGSIALWALVVFLVLIYVANIFSPPPPDASAIAWVALAAWLFVPWGAWIDRHRQPTP